MRVARAGQLNRRQFGSGLLLGAAGLAAPGLLLAQSRPERRKVTIAVSGRTSFYYLPLTIAEQLGYFQAEGLTVEVEDFANGGQAQQAVLAGAADVVSGAYEHTIHLQAQGRLFQAFVLQGRAPQIAVGVSTRTMQGYRSLADLRGKRIGVTAPGSSSNMVAKLLLSRAGVRPNEVSFIGVGGAESALAAIRSGQIDAMSNIDPVMTMLEQKGDVHTIADTRTLRGTHEVFGGPMPAGCLHAPMAFLQRNPNTVQALTNAMVHALKWLQTAGPGDLIKTVPEGHLLDDRAVYLAAFEKVREAIATDGLFPEQGSQTAWRALLSLDAGLQASRIDLEKTYTNEFARRAKERFKA